MNNSIKYIDEIRNRKIFTVNGTILDLISVNNEKHLEEVMDYVCTVLINKVDFEKEKLLISLRDFMIIGFFCYNEELSQYFQYYIQKLILRLDGKKISELCVLQNIFNLKNTTEVQYTIHESTEKLNYGHNKKIKEFINQNIYNAEIILFKKLLINNDLKNIIRVVRTISITRVLQISSTYCKKEAINYFDYIITNVLKPQQKKLCLNGVLAAAFGLERKRIKELKNSIVSEENNELYENIYQLIEKNNSDYFFLSQKEMSLVSEIEFALNNQLKLNSNKLSSIDPNRMINICLIMFRENLILYLNNLKSFYKDNNIIITRVNLMQNMFLDLDAVKANHIYTYYKMTNKDTLIEMFITEVFKEQVREQDSYKINIEQDVWKVRWAIKERYISYTYDFSVIEDSLIKRELKKYYKFILERELKYKTNNSTPKSLVINKALVIYSVKYMHNEFKINSFSEIRRIHVYRLIIHLKDEYRKMNNEKLSISSIVKCIGNLKNIFEWLNNQNMFNTYDKIVNPFDYVVFKGVNYKNTDIIPECVIDKILYHLSEVRDDIQRMTLILLNCGLRFKEVAYLEEDCLDESTEEIKVLKYIPYKILEARRKNGLDDYHRIAISDEIYNEIKIQINHTENLRKEFQTKEIFLEMGLNDNLRIISNTTFTYQLQSLINRHKICDESGNIWHITSKQYRKTLAVDMITKGDATVDELSNYLSHLSRTTTDKYYAEVRKMKLAEMNSNFFKKKFKLLLDEEQLEKFTIEERKSLYVDFCLGSREVEYGVCTANFTVDTCNKREDIFSCATCTKMCTGKKYYDRWNRLYKEQEYRVNKLHEFYEKNNIKKEEYETFREYEKEKYLLDAFADVLKKITSEG